MISILFFLSTYIQSVVSVSGTYYGDYNSLTAGVVTCSDHAPGLCDGTSVGGNSDCGKSISSFSQLHNAGNLYATAWNSVGYDGDAAHCLHCLTVSYGGKSTQVTVIDRKGAAGVDLSDAAFDCLFGANAHVGGGNYEVTVTDNGAGPCAGGGGCSSGTPATTAAPNNNNNNNNNAQGCTKYPVASGDYGWGIASKFGLDFNNQLSPWNPSVNWGALQIGQLLCVSAPGTAPQTTAAPTTTTRAPTTTTAAPSGGCTKYVVQQGDGGWAISQKLGVSWSDFQSWNPGVNWNNLQIGQVLCASAAQANVKTSLNNDQKKWAIPLLVIVGVLFIALIVFILRKKQQRERSYSQELGLQAERAPKEQAILTSGPPTTQPTKATWEKKIDENTGRTYYYNQATGVSQWEVPEGM
jgi:LysM repeat protein